MEKASGGSFARATRKRPMTQDDDEEDWDMTRMGRKAVAQRHYRLSGKVSLAVRTKYRLEAYATLRRRVVAESSRR